MAGRWDGYVRLNDPTSALSLPSGYTYCAYHTYHPKYTTNSSWDNYIDGDKITKWAIYCANSNPSGIQVKLKILRIVDTGDETTDYFQYVNEGALQSITKTGWNEFTETVTCQRGDVVGIYVTGGDLECSWSNYIRQCDRISGDFDGSTTFSVGAISGDTPSHWDSRGIYIKFYTSKTSISDTEPSISSISKTSYTMTIKGSNFLDKSPAAPAIFDDFEDGIDSAWEFQFGQESVSGEMGVTTTASRYTGDQTHYYNWFIAGTNGKLTYADGDYTTSSTEVTVEDASIFDSGGGALSYLDDDDHNLRGRFSYTGISGNTLTGVTGIDSSFSDGAYIADGQGESHCFAQQWTGYTYGTKLYMYMWARNDFDHWGTTNGETDGEDSFGGNFKWMRTWTNEDNDNNYYATGSGNELSRMREFADCGSTYRINGFNRINDMTLNTWHLYETYYNIDNDYTVASDNPPSTFNGAWNSLDNFAVWVTNANGDLLAGDNTTSDKTSNANLAPEDLYTNGLSTVETLL